jgi:hypothetical protein
LITRPGLQKAQMAPSRETTGNVNFTVMEKLNIRVRAQGHRHNSHVPWASRSNTVPTTGLRKSSENVQVLYVRSQSMTCPNRTRPQHDQQCGRAPEQPTRVSCVRVNPVPFRFPFATLLGGGCQREHVLLLQNADQRRGVGRKERVSEMSFSPISDFFHISLRLLKKCLSFSSHAHLLHFKKGLL